MAKTIMLDGKVWRWSEVLRLRREQRKAERQPHPTLFELKHDVRPPMQANADQRYEEPPLFKL
ncbi:MAG: hypothetical protein KF889_01660 [Alphaproteobacteria bacterium]|nr:hypothetical protein [Alphaproteobacteria bacterium]MCW5741614.1 hypothetical protein [Alphaproteobacteria bacterium]